MSTGHARALAFTQGYRELMLTTDWIVTEVADALASRRTAPGSCGLFRVLQQQTELTIVPASRVLMDEGIEFYENRPDKEWSLTDCISFVVMTKRDMTEALTGDHHFEQAGFTALLQ